MLTKGANFYTMSLTRQSNYTQWQQAAQHVKEAPPEMCFSFHVSGELEELRKFHSEFLARDDDRLTHSGDEDRGYVYTTVKKHIPYTPDIENTVGLMAIKYPALRIELSIRSHKPDFPSKSIVYTNGHSSQIQLGRYCQPGELDKETFNACIQKLADRGMYRASELLAQSYDQMAREHDIITHLENEDM